MICYDEILNEPNCECGGKCKEVIRRYQTKNERADTDPKYATIAISRQVECTCGDVAVKEVSWET